MEGVSCIIIVGKPGAGKSSIGTMLAELLEAHYMSLGSFMREHLNIPDPHIGVDKGPIYEKLHTHFSEDGASQALVLDCHPYPEEDFNALRSFINRPTLKLWAVIHIDADDEIALRRLEARPRPGQAYRDRLKYYNDHKHCIEALMEHPSSIRIENNTDFEDREALREIARTILNVLALQEYSSLLK